MAASRCCRAAPATAKGNSKPNRPILCGHSMTRHAKLIISHIGTAISRLVSQTGVSYRYGSAISMLYHFSIQVTDQNAVAATVLCGVMRVDNQTRLLHASSYLIFRAS